VLKSCRNATSARIIAKGRLDSGVEGDKGMRISAVCAAKLVCSSGVCHVLFQQEQTLSHKANQSMLCIGIIVRNTNTPVSKIKDFLNINAVSWKG
jgi:hypothetical protein